MDREYIEHLKGQFSKPLTEKEKRLLQDMRFVIDFVLDHDLSMDLVVEVVWHDLDEIRRNGSLKNALFLPKSHDFSNY